MSYTEGGYHFEEVQEVSQELDEQITEAQQQIDRCREFKATLSELEDKISYFDSTACGSLEVNEEKIKATISAPEIGEKLRNLHQDYEWYSMTSSAP